MKRAIAIAASCSLAAAGCASFQRRDAFDYRFADNVDTTTQEVVGQLPAPASPETRETPLVVATTDDGDDRAVAAFSLETGESLWRTDVDALTRPEVEDDVVILSARGETEEVVALDSQTGSVLWRRPTDSMAFVGGDRGGSTIVYATSVGASGGATRKAAVRAVDARTGSVRWEHQIDGVLGRPAIAGQMVFVPWERQNIAILDLATGIEKARLRTTDDVISWVTSTPAGVYFGSNGIYRLTGSNYGGNKEEAAYRPPPLPEAPQSPMVHEDGFLPSPGTRSARGRIRIYFEPSATDAGAVGILDDTFYYVYYRYVFAFTGEGELRWVRVLDQTVGGATVVAGGLLSVGEEGAVHLLAVETGNDRWASELDASSLASVTVAAPSFAPGGSAGEPRDLRTTLNEVALDPDNRLVAARAFAIELLAELEDPDVTRDLLDLYEQRAMPGALKEAIGTALRSRPEGVEYLVQSLDQHFDYIDDTRSPPLGLIVPSLLEREAESAVPGLIEQMLDHETPLAVLPLVVRAVVDLGDETVVPELERFLQLYHRDSTFIENPEAVIVAAEGLFRHGGAEGRETLQALIGAEGTPELLATGIREFFDREEAEAEAAEAAEAVAAAAAAEAAAREEEANRPLRLSQEQVNATLAENAEALRECIRAELERNPRLAQVRFAFILNRDGSSEGWNIVPRTPEFVECAAPKVEAVEFPAFRARRMRATVILNLGNRQADVLDEEAIPDDAPWWVRHRARTEIATAEASSPLPWWVRRAAPQPAPAVAASTRPQPASAAPAGATPVGPTPASPTPASPTRAGPTPASPTRAGPTPASPTRAGPTAASPTPAAPTDPTPPAPTSPANDTQEEPAREEPVQPWWLPSGG